MTLSKYSHFLLPAVEEELKAVVDGANLPDNDTLHTMLAYHMGWSGPGAGPKAQGKRIRPLLLLLTTIANGGEWQLALPAAAAIELIHNFSLIHDDIEDKSEYRRGRETLWKIHQVPLALNAGDAMYSLAYISLERLSSDLGAERILKAHTLLAQTCLALTKGQHLDISFENDHEISVENYLEMIQGKTAALLSCTTQLGALLAGADQESIETFRQLGFNIGIAFQIQDDFLGIWGDPAITGKSAASDLIARKKSLPILYGLQQKGEFAQAWAAQEITESNASSLAKMLENEGALGYTKERVEHYTTLALKVLRQNQIEDSSTTALEELFLKLLKRTA